jgi:hypothetical protein
MKRFKQPRQHCLALLSAVALALSLTLSACGAPTNAANNSSTHTSVITQPQQYQPSVGPGTGSRSNVTAGGGNVSSSDQQIRSLLRQLDGVQNDVNTADTGATSDGGQP